MNKLFKLIYVNLLSLFDINKIIIAREDGVKSNLEKRAIFFFNNSKCGSGGIGRRARLRSL